MSSTLQDVIDNISSLDVTIPAAAATAALIVAVALWQRSSKAYALPLPPSPPGAHWFYGHNLRVPRSYMLVEQWIQQYGPVIMVKHGLRRSVIVGRYQAAVDIMEKQGGASVSRPRMVAAGEILSDNMRLVFTPSGDRFRKMRRALHSHLQPRAAESYEPIQTSHARIAVLALLESPQDFQLHTKTYAASVALQVAYGKMTPTSALDPDVQSVQRAMNSIRLAFSGYLVETYPWLRHVPGYARELKEAHVRDTELYMRQLANVRKQLNQSDEETGPSFARWLLEHAHEYNLTDKEMAYLAGSIFTAGSDTTAAAICMLLMVSALHPEAQAKVQEEMDTVIGRDRVPTFADERSLPQLRAFIAEAMRWRPIAAGGVQHETTEDIIYNGYLIPAKTIITGNHWAISRDPDVFPDPDKFDPQRWINSQGEFRDDMRSFAFGFGRRACPGQHVATRSIFINTVLVLWSFRLSVDRSKPVNEYAYLGSMLPPKPPLTIKFEPRIDVKELRAVMEGY